MPEKDLKIMNKNIQKVLFAKSFDSQVQKITADIAKFKSHEKLCDDATLRITTDSIIIRTNTIEMQRAAASMQAEMQKSGADVAAENARRGYTPSLLGLGGESPSNTDKKIVIPKDLVIPVMPHSYNQFWFFVPLNRMLWYMRALWCTK